MNFNIKTMSYSISEQELKSTIEEILRDDSFDYLKLMQPIQGKNYWENCAKILCGLDKGKMSQYIPAMLEWLQDLNWPGAVRVLIHLKSFPNEIIKKPLEDDVYRAVEAKDDEWLYGLSSFIQNKELCNILDPNILKELQSHFTIISDR